MLFSVLDFKKEWPERPKKISNGPRIKKNAHPCPIPINILCFADHQIMLSGLRTGKVWEPLAVLEVNLNDYYNRGRG